MTEFNIKNYDGKMYLKEDIKRILNTNPIKALANAKTVVMFSDNITLEDVEESLKVILKDIKLRRKGENINDKQ